MRKTLTFQTTKLLREKHHLCRFAHIRRESSIAACRSRLGPFSYKGSLHGAEHLAFHRTELHIYGRTNVVDEEEHSFVSSRLVQLEPWRRTKANFGAEDYRYLDGLCHNTPLEDLQQMVVELLQHLRQVLAEDPKCREAHRRKGHLAEAVVAIYLMRVAKELGGRPITDYPLFSHLDPIFRHYTLAARGITFDSSLGSALLDAITSRRADSLIMPSQKAGPDIMCVLRPVADWAKKDLPLAVLCVGSKMYTTANREAYRKNYLSTLLENLYLRESRIVARKQHDEIKPLLREARGVSMLVEGAPHGPGRDMSSAFPKAQVRLNLLCPSIERMDSRKLDLACIREILYQ